MIKTDSEPISTPVNFHKKSIVKKIHIGETIIFVIVVKICIYISP